MSSKMLCEFQALLYVFNMLNFLISLVIKFLLVLCYFVNIWNKKRVQNPMKHQLRISPKKKKKQKNKDIKDPVY